MIRIAMLSFWHVHAWDYARQALDNPATEVVAVWDEQPERGQTQAALLGVPFYADLDDLLAQPGIDAVIVDTPTKLHRTVIIAAARAGKHIFTEKVIAPTVLECNAIMAAIEEAGVRLTVSLPRLNTHYTVAIRDILKRNLLGEITLVRTRLSHNGAISTAENPNGWLPVYFYNREQCGGGAMIDLGCHPMYLTRLFLGLPESVSASYGYITGKEVEDNAAVTLRYPNGAIGIVEAGFVNRFSPFTIEAHGTEGSLLYGTPHETLLIRSSLLTIEDWHTPESQLDEQPSAFQQWVGHIQQGSNASENIQMALDLTLLMEAANLSARTNQPIGLDTVK